MMHDSGFAKFTSTHSSAPEFTVHGRAAVVGRSSSADVTVNLPGIADRHCRVLKSGRRVMIEDLKSGTRVNGEQISRPVEVNTGDLVTFGSVVYQFHNLIPAPAPVPAPSPVKTAADSKPEPETPTDPVASDVDNLASTDDLDAFLAPSDPPAAVPRKPPTAPKFQDTTQPQAKKTRQSTEERRRKDAKVSKTSVEAKSTPAKKNKKQWVPDQREIDAAMDDVLFSDEPLVNRKKELVIRELPECPPEEYVAPKPKSLVDSVGGIAGQEPQPENARKPEAAKSDHETEIVEKRKTRRRARSTSSSQMDLKKPAMIAGGCLLLLLGYWMFSGPGIDREAVLAQATGYLEQLKEFKQTNNSTELEKLKKTVEQQESLIAQLKASAESSKHETDKQLLFVFRDSLPRALAPRADNATIQIIEMQLDQAKKELNR